MTELSETSVQSTDGSASGRRRLPNRTVWMSARDEPPAEATITWALDDDESTEIDLAGVLCTLTVHRVRELIDEVANASPAPVAIDMSGVTFIDGRGLSLMLMTRDRLAERGLGCEIVRPSPIVRRLFDIVGLDHLLSA